MSDILPRILDDTPGLFAQGDGEPSGPQRRPALTRVAALARYFRARPQVWIDGRELAGVGGAYAWRTRLSDLRHAPFWMVIENRQRRIVAVEGRPAVRSEYRFVSERSHAAGAIAPVGRPHGRRYRGAAGQLDLLDVRALQ